MRKNFNIDGKYVVLSVSTNIQSPAVIVTVKLSDRMPDIDSISVAFPVRSMRSAEHFVMNATEEEGGTSENGIYGHSRFCNTDFDDKLACLNLSGV
ncbi:hypothetical protein ACVX3V_23350 (plasmid) [Escherichia coli]|uniref:hypothetical protein n=1 Tax=Escherichia coli TaxID=562 RepID=UPI000B2500FB|nr:hypothetical protein [Escherichia coli]